MPFNSTHPEAAAEYRHVLRRTLIGLLLLSILGTINPAAAAETKANKPARQSDLVSGTLEAMDAAALEVRIRTDVGQPVIVKVPNTDLLRDLTTGDRVTAVLDAKGKARKITKVAIPELPQPAAVPEGSEPGPPQDVQPGGSQKSDR